MSDRKHLVFVVHDCAATGFVRWSISDGCHFSSNVHQEIDMGDFGSDKGCDPDRSQRDDSPKETLDVPKIKQHKHMEGELSIKIYLPIPNLTRRVLLNLHVCCCSANVR
jgi:hypothetical protein